MEVRGVEEVALEAPDLAVHLAPLGARIDVDLDRGLRGAPLARPAGAFSAGGHGTTSCPATTEHLRAVGGEQERARALRSTGLPPSIFSSSFSVLRVLRSKRKTFCGGASSSSDVVLVGEDRRGSRPGTARPPRPSPAPRSSRARWAGRRCAGRCPSKSIFTGSGGFLSSAFFSPSFLSPALSAPSRRRPSSPRPPWPCRPWPCRPRPPRRSRGPRARAGPSRSTAAYTLLVTERAMLVMSSQPWESPALVEAMK